MNIDERCQKALQYFVNGYSCTQSVLVALADLVNLEEKTAIDIASAFCGGIGRAQSICGAISGALMAISLKEASQHTLVMHKNSNVRLLSDQFINEFKTLHGNVNCAEIVERAQKNHDDKHDACKKVVENAVKIAYKIITAI